MKHPSLTLADPRTRSRLAAEADVAAATVERYRRLGPRGLQPRTAARIATALASLGIEPFDGPGDALDAHRGASLAASAGDGGKLRA